LYIYPTNIPELINYIKKEIPMTEQSYTNHRRYVPGYHFVLCGLILLYTAGALYFCIKSLIQGTGHLAPVFVLVSAVIFILFFIYTREFAVKAQDRAIRAEENLRHFVLTGKVLNPALNMRQIVALRFASDEEFVALSVRATAENLTNDAIKQEIKNWRTDHARV
jgi:hypothetical protein